MIFSLNNENNKPVKEPGSSVSIEIRLWAAWRVFNSRWH